MTFKQLKNFNKKKLQKYFQSKNPGANRHFFKSDICADFANRFTNPSEFESVLILTGADFLNLNFCVKIFNLIDDALFNLTKLKIII